MNLSDNLSKTKMQRLIVTEQPQSQFYKDEGGKSNFLQASIQLISQDGQPVAASGLQIKCELYLENGTYIEDQSILKMAAKSPVRLNQYGASTFAFRVEMVSRRVDQQKFVLKLSPAQPQMIDSVMTEGVFVMSKRKNRPISSLTTIGLKRARLESQAEEWKQMETFIREQHTATNRLILDRLNLLIESVHNLDARVDRIERRLDQGVNVGTNRLGFNFALVELQIQILTFPIRFWSKKNSKTLHRKKFLHKKSN
eukprot:TRINITY_DN4019_c0_g1_i1.p1 TRINITY_DN4019_c0_g1~~TRINITY_DN4019_c0_g1_i1.p1  ORF type:complete len:255 (-),score=55.00 TRINITY_DN4019_c0_g1_i1:760-1524(-)